MYLVKCIIIKYVSGVTIEKYFSDETTFYRKKENSPADNAGLFSYVYITWMTPYLWKAYKKGLTIKDLPDISVYDTCEYNALR